MMVKLHFTLFACALGYMPAMHAQRVTIVTPRHAVSPRMKSGFDFKSIREGLDEMMAGSEKSLADVLKNEPERMTYEEMKEYCRDDESVGCDLDMLERLRAETKGQGYRVPKAAKAGVEWSKDIDAGVVKTSAPEM